MDWGAGITSFSFGYNWNKTEITRRTNHGTAADPIYYLSDEGVYDNENGLPEWRANLGARHTWSNDLTLSVRANLYGDYSNVNDSDFDPPPAQFDGGAEIDFDLTWDFNDGAYSLTVGGNNIFDNTPDPVDKSVSNEGCCGRIYRSDSVVDWQGPYYYVRGTVHWD